MAGRLKAFIAGATGYTGRYVVEECVRSGTETVAHVRPDSSRLEHWKMHFEGLGAAVDTTAWEPEAMASTLAQLEPTHVFALLGTTRARDGSSDRYEKVDYGLTKILLDAATPVGARFIYLSVLGADRAEPRGSGYTAVRARIEAELRASGLSHVIARPAFISGSDREEQRLGERSGAVVTNAFLAVSRAVGAKRLADRFATLSGAELAIGLVRLGLGSADNLGVGPEQLKGPFQGPFQAPFKGT